MPAPAALPGRDRFWPPPSPVPFTPDARAELPDGAEVVVVGAGVLGASAAFHLARAGARPVVLEANAPAWGASGRNAGMALAGLGGHFERVTRLVQRAGGRSVLDYTMRSLDLLEELDGELTGGIHLDRRGSLDLFCAPGQLDHGRRLAEIQRAEGLEVELLDAGEVARRAPALDRERLLGAKWTRRDATLNPFRLVYGLLEGAISAGARVVTGVRVERLLVRGGRTAGVATSHGELATGAVLLATNAWTPSLAPHLGANLTPIREHVCVTEPLPPLLEHGFETNLCNEYWRQMRTGEIVIGGYAAADEQMGIGTYVMEVTPRIPPLLAALLGRMHAAAADARVVRCWAGLLDFASLEIPMAGALPAEDGTPIPGAWLGCGLTGHGMPWAPILGLLLAELITGGAARTLPLDPFDPRRYLGTRHTPSWLEAFGAVPAGS